MTKALLAVRQRGPLGSACSSFPLTGACPPTHPGAQLPGGGPWRGSHHGPLPAPLPEGCHHCLRRAKGGSERAGHLPGVTQKVSRRLGLAPKLERPRGACAYTPRPANSGVPARQGPRSKLPAVLSLTRAPASPRDPAEAQPLPQGVTVCSPTPPTSAGKFGQAPGTKGPQFPPGAIPARSQRLLQRGLPALKEPALPYPPPTRLHHPHLRPSLTTGPDFPTTATDKFIESLGKS